MNEEKLNALQRELQQCKSDYLALAAEVDSLKAQLAEMREQLNIVRAF